jgi:hypothetical protein
MFTVLNGREFNAKYGHHKFYKMLPRSMVSGINDFKYQEGLNVDTNKFNPSGECEGGGIYFTDEENIDFYARYGYGELVADVEIPGDSHVYIENIKYKADKIQISNIREYRYPIRNSEQSLKEILVLLFIGIVMFVSLWYHSIRL